MVHKCKVKICGLFRPEDAVYVNEALPDYVGFVFVPESRRCVDVEQATALRKAIDTRIKAVGVFRAADPKSIAELVHAGVIQLIQLHGGEDEAYIRELRDALGAVGQVTPIIRAARVDEKTIDVQADCSADYLLFDQGAGGTGKCFDRQVLKDALKKGLLPQKLYFIAGGVDMENLHDILKEEPYGIDVSSGVETNGVKDRQKILELVRAVR
jgi:phosphoribosylanthranilate isomerase